MCSPTRPCGRHTFKGCTALRPDPSHKSKPRLLLWYRGTFMGRSAIHPIRKRRPKLQEGGAVYCYSGWDTKQQPALP